MPHRVLAPAGAVALAGPTALAFFAGGYFDEPRLFAGLVACVLAVAVGIAAPAPLPRQRAGRVAIAGLVGLAAWVALSITWAPLRGPALDDAQRVALYALALVVAAALLRGPLLRRVEPALVAGSFVVVAYGLIGRLLPGIVEQTNSRSAGGRLEQPLTYWNAMGALAAIGLLLAARMAGDTERSDRERGLAAASVPVLGLGVYLSFSRGALAAAAAGVLVLVALAPAWPQFRALILAAEGSAAAALLASRFDGVQKLTGSLGTREGEGVVVLLGLVAISLGIAALAAHECRAERAGRHDTGLLPIPRRLAPAIAAGGFAVIAIGTFALAGGRDQGGRERPAGFGARSDRLVSLQSNRYDYWRVARREFARHPLRGGGSGSFQVDWIQERRYRDPARDAHSLELETAAELGIVGLALLAALIGGIGLSLRRAGARDPGLVAGWAAALTAFGLHSAIDWDWELPALTLVAVLLAGAAIAAADEASA